MESTRWSNFGLYQSQHGSRDKESNCAVDPTFDIAPDYVWNLAEEKDALFFPFLCVSLSEFLFIIIIIIVVEKDKLFQPIPVSLPQN